MIRSAPLERVYHWISYPCPTLRWTPPKLCPQPERSRAPGQWGLGRIPKRGLRGRFHPWRRGWRDLHYLCPTSSIPLARHDRRPELDVRSRHHDRGHHLGKYHLVHRGVLLDHVHHHGSQSCPWERCDPWIPGRDFGAFSPSCGERNPTVQLDLQERESVKRNDREAVSGRPSLIRVAATSMSPFTSANRLERSEEGEKRVS